MGVFLPFLFGTSSASAGPVSLVSSLGNNTCLEVPGGSAGAQLQINKCNGSDNQLFSLQSNGQIRFGWALCLDAWAGSSTNGAAVSAWYCTNMPNQTWTRTATGEIKAVTGKCVDIANATTATLASLWTCSGSAGQKWTAIDPPGSLSVAAGSNCAVTQFTLSTQDGVAVPSPDGSKYFLNKDDSAGVPQIYVGTKGGTAPVCITCTDIANGPKAGKMKMQPHWHPSGGWIVMAVEQDKYSPPVFATHDMIEGLLQSGVWVDMWATTPDGSKWIKLQDFGPKNPADGFTGVAFTPDGKRGAWAQMVDGNVFTYTFGRWQLMIADFSEVNGVLTIANAKNITPPDTYWIEPGNFSPNGRDLLLSADQGFPDHSKVTGQDQYILDTTTGVMTNLTNTPAVWDEHGVFSPDGQKILFMSSYPYRSDASSSSVLLLKSEFMMMDRDGSHLQQISHFNTPGYTESSMGRAAAAVGGWNSDGGLVVQKLLFPKYETWQVQFQGTCGTTPTGVIQ